MKLWGFQEELYCRHFEVSSESFHTVAPLLPIARCPLQQDGTLAAAMKRAKSILDARKVKETNDRGYDVLKHRPEVGAHACDKDRLPTPL